MNITVYGAAEITYIAYFYLSYEPSVVNLINYRQVTDGINWAMGCFYSPNGCNPVPPVNLNPNSNSSFRTGQAPVLNFNENNFYIGVNRMIMTWAGDTSTRGEFNIINIVQSSDASITVSFNFSGNAND